MYATYRQLTAGLLLSSYLLATAATWLHTGHAFLDAGGSCRTGATQCCAPCGGPHESVGRQAGKLVCGDPRVVQRGESSGEHRHQSDQCLLCRFLVIKKSAEIPAGPTISTAVLPQPVALAAPALRIVELHATPDCRAPPHVC